MLMGLKIAGDFGATIAIPVIVFVLIGQCLDDRYDSYPLFLILAFIISVLLSGLMIYKKAKKYGREYSELDKMDSKKIQGGEEKNN